MPARDDFDLIDDFDQAASGTFDDAPDEPTEEEIAAARRVLARQRSSDEYPPELDSVGEEADDEDADAEEESPRRPNRQARRQAARQGRAIPANAPRPQDHKKPKRPRAKAAAQAEVDAEDAGENEVEILGEVFTFDLAEMQKSWDVQEGFADGNPIKVVRGTLGAAQYARLRAKSVREGIDADEVLLEASRAIAASLGLGELGN